MSFIRNKNENWSVIYTDKENSVHNKDAGVIVPLYPVDNILEAMLNMVESTREYNKDATFILYINKLGKCGLLSYYKKGKENVDI